MAADHLHRFVDYLKMEKRYSAHTVRSYANDLGQFKTYLEENYSETDLLKATFAMVRSWMVALMKEGMSPRSVNRKISSLKSFYNFLKRRGEIDNNPAGRVTGPKIAKRLPQYVQENQLHQLFDTLDEQTGFTDMRDRLILELFYSTGIRRSELIGLADSDVLIEMCAIRVLGKGNKERILPLSPVLMRKITRYLEIRDAHFEVSGELQSLFLTDKGRSLYPKFVYNLVKKYLDTVTTIEKRSPHILRHSFATHMSNNGADLNAIKALLGHASLAATQIYTHNSIEKLKEAYLKAHPRGQ